MQAITAADIAHALGGRGTAKGWLCHCPAHRDRSPSLTVVDGDNGRPVFHCWAGCTFEEVRAALAAEGLWSDQAVSMSPEEIERRRREREAREEAENKVREAEALAVWRNARPIEADDLAGRYLRSRGFLPPFPPCLRQGTHRSSSGREWPAMVAGACRYPGRAVVAVQVSPLAEPGRKAWSKPSRITTGRLPGAAVRVSPWREGQRVVLTEGVEDALAVAAACPDVAAWAVLGTANAATVQLPHRALVTLCLDGDDAGQKATAAAMKALRSSGHDVLVAALPDGLDPAAMLAEVQA
ncbi:DUF7146 domain-containing protein [Geminicoccus harenae]|uniref:DUF7146 domain-containing protein n=1 Tax=Geminicoccus harenae TaxID=2498453 RepID=UPI001C97CF3E|nr:toprim domain-containing protein [Geminicoccus harenae]